LSLSDRTGAGEDCHYLGAEFFSVALGVESDHLVSLAAFAGQTSPDLAKRTFEFKGRLTHIPTLVEL
jgi:hypothetical protein